MTKENNEITLLGYIFKHSDDFKGATGSKFEPITIARYNKVLEMDCIKISNQLINAKEVLKISASRQKRIERNLRTFTFILFKKINGQEITVGSKNVLAKNFNEANKIFSSYTLPKYDFATVQTILPNEKQIIIN